MWFLLTSTPLSRCTYLLNLSFFFLPLKFVTSSGCINMTKCPRKIEEIEAVMAGVPWPIKKTTFPSENRQA